MLEGKNYCAADMVLLIVCGFSHHVTGYANSPDMTGAQAMYSSLMSRYLSGKWKRGRIREELKPIGTEL